MDKSMKKSDIPTSAEIWQILKEAAIRHREIEEMIKQDKQERKQAAQQREQERKQAAQQREQERKQAAQQREQEKKEWEKEKKEMARQGEIRKREVEKSFKRLSDLFSNQWGDLLEALAEKSLVKIFKNWDIKVSRTIHHLPGSYNGKYREFDFVVINGTELVVVEVKSTLNQKKTGHFLNTMADFKKYCHEYKKFKVHAGIAYLKADENTVKYAIKKGLFVIRIGGDTAHLINKEGFKPKVF